MWLLFYFLYYIISYNSICSTDIADLNIPPEHVAYVFTAFPTVANFCLLNPDCPFKEQAKVKACWGYERDCKNDISYPVRPLCPGDHRGWVKTKAAQYDTFYTQSDFGYIKEQINDLMVMCEASYPDDTSLECSKYLRFCRGRNMMLNFTGLIGRGDNLRYKMDILGPGQIGGYCQYYSERLLKEAEHMSALQSWAPELVHFVKTPQRPIVDGICDVVIKKPTYIMKLDATVNMYHHFCDFFNLYASLHVNSTHPSTFSKDNHILVWETYTYDSAFKEAFKAFTNNPIWDLKTFRGKVVCFKNVVLPLLPRMIFGLYYNTPLALFCGNPLLDVKMVKINLLSFKFPPSDAGPRDPTITPTHRPMLDQVMHKGIDRPPSHKSHVIQKSAIIYGCERSGLFHAFSKHILHSLNIKLQPRSNNNVRITLLSRGTTYRSILNEKAIIEALQKVEGYEVKRVVYDKTIPFTKQLEITHNTDVFIGMHGAGLTHLLFLPDWAAVFEVYNCEDPNCYLDLTRLRGLKYVTWEDKNKLVQQDQGHGPGGGSHAKFTNYSFDVQEFLRLVAKCVEHVRKQKQFNEFLEASGIRRPREDL